MDDRAMARRSTALAAEILLVEDNPGDVELTRIALKDAKLSNNLHVVEDGERAVDFLHRRGEFADGPRPDLILLDLNLPRMDGREVLQEIKSDPELRKIPLVVLTTSSAEQDILESYKLYANCYVTKPVDINSFVDVVRAIDDFWLSVVKLPSMKG